MVRGLMAETIGSEHGAYNLVRADFSLKHVYEFAFFVQEVDTRHDNHGFKIVQAISFGFVHVQLDVLQLYLGGIGEHGLEHFKGGVYPFSCTFTGSFLTHEGYRCDFGSFQLGCDGLG